MKQPRKPAERPSFTTGDMATGKHASACRKHICMMCCQCWCHYGFQR